MTFVVNQEIGTLLSADHILSHILTKDAMLSGIRFRQLLHMLSI